MINSYEAIPVLLPRSPKVLPVALTFSLKEGGSRKSKALIAHKSPSFLHGPDRIDPCRADLGTDAAGGTGAEALEGT